MPSGVPGITGKISLDIRYCATHHMPQELIKKYTDRGFTVAMNGSEYKHYMLYYNIYPRLPMSERINKYIKKYKTIGSKMYDESLHWSFLRNIVYDYQWLHYWFNLYCQHGDALLSSQWSLKF